MHTIGVAARELDEVTVQTAEHIIGHVMIEKVRHNSHSLRLLARALGRPIRVDGCPFDEQEHHLVDDKTQFATSNKSYTYEIYHGCVDPQANQDESDAYRETQNNVIFIGVPTCGGTLSASASGVSGGVWSSGDYNDGMVFCWRRDIEAVAEVLIDLARTFLEYEKELNLSLSSSDSFP